MLISSLPTPIRNFEEYKRLKLSKIHTYTDENRKTIYFYFFKGKRSDYYLQNELKNLRVKIEEHETELINEFRKIKRQALQPA